MNIFLNKKVLDYSGCGVCFCYVLGVAVVLNLIICCIYFSIFFYRIILLGLLYFPVP